MYRLNEKLRALQPYEPINGEGMIHLDANESFLPLPESALAQVRASLDSLDFNRYPDPAAAELCAAFAGYYGVPAKNVVAGNGSDELITVLFSAFLQKGETFATVEPDFSMYAFNGFLQEARHVAIEKDDCRLNVDRVIETCAREDVKLLIFSNPCNPTSLVCPREDIRRLIRGVSGLVVLDEAYMDFSDQSLLAEFEDFDNLILLRTCSKAVGTAALRLGFAVARKELAEAIRAAKSPYNVNALSQKLGAAVLNDHALLNTARETILASCRELTAGLRALCESYPGRFRLLPGETNFAALVLPDCEAAYRFLWQRNIAVRLTGGLLRVTCGTSNENQALLRALEEYLKTSA